MNDKTEVSIRSFGDYSSPNYGAHSLRVCIGSLTLYFSYETVVAFNSPKSGFHIRENDWSSTTGKHLNAIDRDKSIRIPGVEFEAKLNETLAAYGLIV